LNDLGEMYSRGYRRWWEGYEHDARTRPCKEPGVAYFIPGNSQRGMHCPKCGLNLDMSMCGYDSYGYLCHAG
jgi:hypothetical protein